MGECCSSCGETHTNMEQAPQWVEAVNKADLMGIRYLHADDPGLIDIPINKNGWTALHMAAHKDKEDIIKYLLLNGADVNAKAYRSGDAALHVAARANNIRAIRLLIRFRADIELRNREKKKPQQLCNSNARREFNKTKVRRLQNLGIEKHKHRQSEIEIRVGGRLLTDMHKPGSNDYGYGDTIEEEEEMNFYDETGSAYERDSLLDRSDGERRGGRGYRDGGRGGGGGGGDRDRGGSGRSGRSRSRYEDDNGDYSGGGGSSRHRKNGNHRQGRDRLAIKDYSDDEDEYSQSRRSGKRSRSRGYRSRSPGGGRDGPESEYKEQSSSSHSRNYRSRSRGGGSGAGSDESNRSRHRDQSRKKSASSRPGRSPTPRKMTKFNKVVGVSLAEVADFLDLLPGKSHIWQKCVGDHPSTKKEHDLFKLVYALTTATLRKNGGREARGRTVPKELIKDVVKKLKPNFRKDKKFVMTKIEFEMELADEMRKIHRRWAQQA